MDTSSQEEFNRFVAEMGGDSQDTLLRPALETNFKNILTSLDNNDINICLGSFTDDITLVVDTKSPGGICKGKEELISHFQDDHAIFPEITTIPIAIIVDRGRITCYAEKYFIYEDESGLMRTTLIICDLDDSHLIQRMEFRKVKEDLEFGESEGDDMQQKSRGMATKMAIQYGM
ncbi:hypothetical protein CTA2_4526 [Colletotrichum tanaceti]|uniref:SnoaL-like domain-containing protein n=1 Tax=Colletotrichum tanaceti TaxID=1306861 RepID=A0A4U6X3S7_9PEZI|nr:hypothetical protein CTA2_4526 [Colletotrichum tanaceti]TKW50022.1 hypothetical protein CTA1_7198 [Colletotrichum tanaceti]